MGCVSDGDTASHNLRGDEMNMPNEKFQQPRDSSLINIQLALDLANTEPRTDCAQTTALTAIAYAIIALCEKIEEISQCQVTR